MADKSPNFIHQQIILGTNVSASVAVERARQPNTPLIIWRDGKIVEISPDDPSIKVTIHKD